VENIYFALTEAFNRDAPTVALASGQAVVFYRIAVMSKDGDWVIRETPEACERVLAELDRRPGIPDPDEADTAREGLRRDRRAGGSSVAHGARAPV
jgi:hypothetical protein